MLDVVKLMAAIITVAILAVCLNRMIDVVEIAEKRGPTKAALSLCLNGGIVIGGVMLLFWAVH